MKAKVSGFHSDKTGFCMIVDEPSHMGITISFLTGLSLDYHKQG